MQQIEECTICGTRAPCVPFPVPHTRPQQHVPVCTYMERCVSLWVASMGHAEATNLHAYAVSAKLHNGTRVGHCSECSDPVYTVHDYAMLCSTPMHYSCLVDKIGRKIQGIAP